MILLPVPHFQLHIRDQKSAKPLQLLHLFFSLMGLPTLVEEPPWFWPQWLSQYPLNRYTVLDYFSHSPFYDEEAKKRCHSHESNLLVQYTPHAKSICH